MKSLVALTILATLSVSQARKQAPHATFMTAQDQKQSDSTMFYMQGVRGVWLGLEHGLFKTKAGETCLNDATTQKIYNIIYAIENQEFGKMTKFIPDILQIYTNVMECKTLDEIQGYEDFCTDAEDHCNPSVIFQNLQKNMFLIVGKLTDISSTVSQDFPAATADEFYTQTYSIGDDIGSTIRAVLAYDENHREKDEKQNSKRFL